MRILEIGIKNVRGLPDLHLKPDGDTLVIWGPNGAGKSGVVDAIDFVLTGRISRLVGAGTGGITLARHGAHIDHDADSVIVTASLQLEGFGEPVVVRRCIASHEDVECPDEARPQLAQTGEIVRRGGLILTRRDILRFVTAEAGTRADQIQELLNLADINEIREAFQRARTELRRKEQAARGAIDTAKAEVNVTLQGEQYSDERLMEIVNECRKALGGAPLDSRESHGLKNGLHAPIQKTRLLPGNVIRL